MSQTKAQIGTLALQAMQVVEGDATPDTNDTTVIEAAYDQVYAKLRTRHLVSWGSTGDIPDEAVNPVVFLVAQSRLSYFNPPADVINLINLGASTAEQDLTEVLQPDYVSQPTPAEYF